ncbi:rcc1 and btb domain containing protein [Anaeramoeba flamelloides]|uniref:Rcc1 and btb domain containing protein n=1 Tax=Anaeramoeba flamelloides TaxID=1746091 RepID=A0AAV8ABH1_9EUKA|nr:rcc1 and btb domain containing protein [Anaeramoeba flamelloides]
MTEKKFPLKRIGMSGNIVSMVDVSVPEGIEYIEAALGDKHCVCIATDGTVYEYNPQMTSYTKLSIGNGIKAACGFDHYLVLTAEGMVYSKGRCTHGELGLGSQHSASVPTMIPFFQKNNLRVVDIKAGVYQSYYLCDNGVLYCSGFNTFMQLGIPDKLNKLLPTKYSDKKVKEIWSNNYAYGIWLRDEDDQIWGYGKHVRNNKKNYSELQILKDKKILKIAPGYQRLLILVEGEGEENEVYYVPENSEPTVWSELTKEKVIDVEYACDHCVALTKDRRILGSTSPPYNYGMAQLPQIQEAKDWKIVSGAWHSMCFPVSPTNDLYLDMLEFYQSTTFANLEIMSRKVHSSILKWRTGKEGTEAIEILKTFSEKHINKFLDWCYLSEVSNINLLQEVAKAFGMQIDPKKTLNDYFLELYHDEESKDYKILVKDNYDDEDDDENEDEDEQVDEYAEISVHKFLLQARSGLFREMFSTVKEEKNQVKDYSGLGIDSLEIFIKYLYTNTIELTADDEPEFVLVELEDVQERFKLNEKSQFSNQIFKLKKTHGIN